MRRVLTVLGIILGVSALAAGPALAADEAVPEKALLADVDTLWTCLAAFLVFFMQAGFSLVEAGLTRAKNACNIFMKNLMDLSVGSLCFWAVGFGIMFGSGSGFFGTNAFFFDPDTFVEEGKTYAGAMGWTSGFGWAFLMFQTVFAATAATIVSGCVAERTKFVAYLVASVVITAVIYPVFGSWAWGSLFLGEGWLERIGFKDFAGSTVVHSVGGWAGLAGAIVVGSRLGKYKGGKATPIPGHSLPLAALGVFILWLGWFGFNAGSTTAIGEGSFAKIAVVTNLAAAGGAIAATLLSWVLFKKPDASFAFNGALAGLVGITAGCADLDAGYATLTGFLCGGLVVLSVLFFDRIRVDDPVGAVSVHGVCGAFGTIAVGLFDRADGLFLGGGGALLTTQCIGVAACFLWAFPLSLALFYGLKVTLGVRVSVEEELEGLDVTEHGMEAYPGFSKELGREPTATGRIAPEAIEAAAKGFSAPAPRPAS